MLVHREVDSNAAQAALCGHGEVRPRHISGEPGNDRGAKGVAERGSGSRENRNRTQCRAIHSDAVPGREQSSFQASRNSSLFASIYGLDESGVRNVLDARL